jgi:hypothetical protein
MPRRLTQRDATNQYSWHAATLCDSHKIDLYIETKPQPMRVGKNGKRRPPKKSDPVTPYADIFNREVHTYPIKNEETYAIALHEIGHVLDPTMAQVTTQDMKLRAPDNLGLADDLSFLAIIISEDYDKWFELRSEWRAWNIARELSLVEFSNAKFQKALIDGLSSYASREDWEVLGIACMAEWEIREKAGSEYPCRKMTSKEWKAFRIVGQKLKSSWLSKVWIHNDELGKRLKRLKEELGNDATSEQLLAELRKA